MNETSSDKYSTGMFAARPKVWRTIDGKGHTYLLPVDVMNIADHVHIDPHDAKSQGYGGGTLTFTLEDGSEYKVKGPWHGGTSALLKEIGLDIRDLHATQVTIWSTKKGIYSGKGYKHHENGTLEWTDIEREIDVQDEIIYEEKEPVLGEFMRGDRIAHAYAKATGKTVYVERESYGGASRGMIGPDTPMHPMAQAHE